jgi:hypothetical protein
MILKENQNGFRQSWLNTGMHIEYNIIHFTIYVVK